MKNRIALVRGNPAFLVSCLALFIALGGASYAVMNVPRNSVGTTQLRKNAVVTGKVRNGTLLRRDFRAGHLPTAPTPAEVRDRLVNVDGAGSGVDADRLDGHDSSAFVREIYSTTASYNPPNLAEGDCDFVQVLTPAGSEILRSDTLTVSTTGQDTYPIQVVPVMDIDPNGRGRLSATACNNGQFGPVNEPTFTVVFRVLR